MNSSTLAERLVTFLEDRRRLSCIDGLEGRAARLQVFLDSIRGMAPGAAVVVPAYPSPERLSVLLEHLAPALAVRRFSGADLNPWTIAGLRFDEVRNAAVLAWLLSPRGSHGLGASLLQRLLEGVRQEGDAAWPDLGRLEEATVVPEERPMGSDRDRVDLAIEGRDFVAFIEVKINAPFAPDQLANYRDSLTRKADNLGKRHRLLITLTRRPLSFSGQDVRSLTWTGMATLIRQSCRAGTAGAGRAAALHFCEHIQQFR